MRKLTGFVLVLALLASLALTVASAAFSSVAMVVGAAYQTISGTASVVGRLKDDLEVQQRRTRDLADDLRSRNEEVSMLRSDVDTKSQRIGQLSDELEVSQRRATQLGDELTGTASVLGRLNDDLEAQQHRMRDLAEDLRLRRAEVSALLAEADTKRQRIGQLSEELQVSQRRTAQLGDELTNLRRQSAVTYRGTTVAAKDAVEDTAARIARRTANGAARNVGSVFAEALPVVGIAAVVGVTAWEVKDSCDTMKDLNELQQALSLGADVSDKRDRVCGLEVASRDEVWEIVKTSPGAAWEGAKSYVPDLPELPVLSADAWSWPAMPDIDWKFWD